MKGSQKNINPAADNLFRMFAICYNLNAVTIDRLRDCPTRTVGAVPRTPAPNIPVTWGIGVNRAYQRGPILMSGAANRDRESRARVAV
jgi:hypothetical protein